MEKRYKNDININSFLKLNGLIASFVILIITSCGDTNNSRKASHPIEYNLKKSFSELNFLEQDLADMRIVQLGENAHGIAEYYLLKTRIVKYLHEELGYNVIAFEGSLGDCASANINMDNLNDTSLMKSCFYKTWNFEEAIPLFSYIKSTQSTESPLVITGFDNIPTGNYFTVFLSDLIHIAAPDKLTTVKYVDSQFNAFVNGQFETDNFESMKQKLIDSVMVLKNTIIAQNELISSQISDPTSNHLLLTQSLENIISTVSIKQSDYSQLTMERMRDSLMASNLIWLVDSIYADEKIIVWGHNAHVSKTYSQIPELNKNRRFKRQGQFINERFGFDTFTIGLYAYKGSGYAFFLKENYDLNQPNNNSLESHMNQLEGDISYLNLKETDLHENKFKWVNDTIASFEWGLFEQSIVPKEHYDALILVDSVSPATLIK